MYGLTAFWRGGQRTVKSEWSPPVHQTFLREAGVMGPPVMAVTMRRRKALAQVSQGVGVTGMVVKGWAVEVMFAIR